MTRDLARYRAALSGSDGERALETHLRQASLPMPVHEYQFIPRRKWRFDFAWPDQKLAVEIEGGTWASGRHNRGEGFARDCEKYAEALCLGWRVLRVTTGQVESGQALAWIERLVGGEK